MKIHSAQQPWLCFNAWFEGSMDLSLLIYVLGQLLKTKTVFSN